MPIMTNIIPKRVFIVMGFFLRIDSVTKVTTEEQLFAIA